MFQGTITALVTPFRPDGAVDYDRFAALIEAQAEAGVDGIIPVGTTGESPTLTPPEHIEVIRAAVRYAAGRLKVIAGTGANSTHEAIELTREVLDQGVDGTLQVTPYYNKPTQTGLLRHFTAVADLGLPVILYNVPGRSGAEIAIPTVAELAKHPNIVCIKEAAGKVDRVSRIKSVCDIDVLSGDDSLTLPMMSLGAVGVISVATNVAPRPVVEMVRAAREGRWDEARALHYKLYSLFTDLFLETNPVPVKAAMEMLGMGPAVYRLPLCEMSPAPREQLRATLRKVGLLP